MQTACDGSSRKLLASRADCETQNWAQTQLGSSGKADITVVPEGKPEAAHIKTKSALMLDSVFLSVAQSGEGRELSHYFRGGGRAFL